MPVAADPDCPGWLQNGQKGIKDTFQTFRVLLSTGFLVKERSPKRLPEVVARGKKERVHRARSEPGRDINAVTENSSVNHVGTDRGPCLEALSLPVAFRAIQCDGPASWRAFLLWHDLYATFQ